MRAAIGRIASSVGKGLCAGVAGTCAMTASTLLEAKLRDRGASSVPSDVAGHVLGVQPRNPEGKKRFSTLMHWGYGSGMGVLRGLLGAAGINGAVATGLHFVAVWGAGLVMLPAADAAPPVTKQEPLETAVDAWHHLVYAVATNGAYRYLDDPTSI